MATLEAVLNDLLGPEGWTRDVPTTDELYRALEVAKYRRELNVMNRAVVIQTLAGREGLRRMSRVSGIPRTTLTRWGDRTPEYDEADVTLDTALKALLHTPHQKEITVSLLGEALRESVRRRVENSAAGGAVIKALVANGMTYDEIDQRFGLAAGSAYRWILPPEPKE